MIKFLLKGILRDRSRSLLPIMVVALGVFLTVFMSGFMKGIFNDITDLNARFLYRSCKDSHPCIF